MTDYKVLVGDNRETLRDIPEGTVQTVVTSPPYYGLRDYGHDGQIGLEETPEQFVQALVDVFREVRRVLRDDGTVWLNLGDSYAGSGKGPPGNIHKGHAAGEARRLEDKHSTIVPDGLKPKDLIGIPWRVAFALQTDGWYLRQDIIWAKPNPMPESVTDRCTKAHEYIFLLSKSPRYYYDAEAIREAVTDSTLSRLSQDVEQQIGRTRANGGAKTNGNLKAVGDIYNGRNRRSVWTVTTRPYSGAHFATFPPKLIEPCILAGSRKGDTVLDPFGGSGTTAGVALDHGRKAILCELNPEYAALVPERINSITDALQQGRLF